MRHRTTVAICGIAVIATVVVVLLLAEGEEGSVVPGSGAVVQEGSLRRSETEDLPVIDSSPSPSHEALGSPVTEVQGQVVRSDGSPVEGAMVWIARKRGDIEAVLDAADHVPVATTDRDGAFALEFPAIDADLEPHIAVFLPPDDLGLSGAGGGGIVLPRCGSVRGALVSRNGEAVTDTTVIAIPQSAGGQHALLMALWRTRTDQDGSFRIIGLPPGLVDVYIEPDADYLYAVMHGVEVHVDPTDLGSVEMLPGGQVQGTVLASDGRPAQDATVIVRAKGAAPILSEGVRYQGMEVTTRRTDGQGRFAAHAIAGDSCEIHAVRPGSPWVRRYDVPVGSEGLELRFEQSGEVEVLVVDAQGAVPLGDAELVVRPDTPSTELPWSPPCWTVTRDPDRAHAHRIRGIGREGATFDVHVPGFVMATVRVVGLAADEERREVVALQRAPTLGGSVIGADDRPVAGATVTLFRVDGNSRLADRDVTTTGTGRFLFAPLDENATYVLQASCPGHEPDQTEPLRPSRQPDDVVLRLTKLATLHGVVVDATGAALAGAAVLVAPVRADGSMGHVSESTADTDGRFTISGLRPGEHLVFASVSSRPALREWAAKTAATSAAGGPLPPGWLRTIVSPDESAEVVVEVCEAGSIRCYGVSRGAGVQGARLVLLAGIAGWWTKLAAGTTGPDGSVSFDGVLPGRHLVVGTLGRKGWPQVRLVDLKAGQSVVVELQFGDGSVEGHVVDASTGEPVTDAEVWMRPGSASGELTLDELGAFGTLGDESSFERTYAAIDGTFRIDDLPAGRWLARAGGGGWLWGPTVTVEVHSNEAVRDLALTVLPGGAIEGSVAYPGDESALVLMLHRVDTTEVIASSLVEGARFRFDGLPAGAFELRAVIPAGEGSGAGDRVLAVTHVAIGEGERAEVELQISP